MYNCRYPLRCTINGGAPEVLSKFQHPHEEERVENRDIGHIGKLLETLEFGSNYNVIDAVKIHRGTNTEIDLSIAKIFQAVRALEYARELMIHAMKSGVLVQVLLVNQFIPLPVFFSHTMHDPT